MHNMRYRVAALFGALIVLAAALGGTAGLVSAGPRESLTTGFNLIGGPRDETSPQDFMSCLPNTSWNSIYIWDSQNQVWMHFFNPAKNVPAYVNLPTVGGISRIPRLTGVAVLMDEAVASPRVKDSSADTC